MTTTTRTRQPKGVPTGGQFATTARTEPQLEDLRTERRDAAFVPYGGEHAGYTATKGVTEGQVEDFTNNACGVLAAEMSRRTGWPVVVVGADPDYSNKVGWVHAGVRRPDGRIIDVAGSWDEANWVDQYAELVDAYGQDEHDDWDGDCVWAFDAEKFGETNDGLATSAAHGDHTASAQEVAAILVAQFVDPA